jgi:hypothetical protein
LAKNPICEIGIVHKFKQGKYLVPVTKSMEIKDKKSQAYLFCEHSNSDERLAHKNLFQEIEDGFADIGIGRHARPTILDSHPMTFSICVDKVKLPKNWENEKQVSSFRKSVQALVQARMNAISNKWVSAESTPNFMSNWGKSNVAQFSRQCSKHDHALAALAKKEQEGPTPAPVKPLVKQDVEGTTAPPKVPQLVKVPAPQPVKKRANAEGEKTATAESQQ